MSGAVSDPMSDAAPMLEVSGLRRRFGALEVARGIELSLPKGARQALIGPNGAGKTTLVNLITGRLRPDAGRIRLDGRDVTAMDPAARVKAGIARTFQINQLFRGLEVVENVAMSVAERRGEGGNAWRPAAAQAEVLDEAMEILAGLGLADDALTPVRLLPYGRQRLVEVAITLGLRPRVLLLDEPAAGVPAADSRNILDVLSRLPAEIAILIIEHDMEVVFRFTERITVLVDGGILTEGTPQEIATDPEVRAVYLGERATPGAAQA